MNRAIYKVTPCCPKCGSLLPIPQGFYEKKAFTTEIPVKCTAIQGRLIICDWKGFAAFYMEDKSSEDDTFLNAFYATYAARVANMSDEDFKAEFKQVRDRLRSLDSIAEHCKNSGCHILTDEPIPVVPAR